MNKEELQSAIEKRLDKEDMDTLYDRNIPTYLDNIYSCLNEIWYDQEFDLVYTWTEDVYVYATVYIPNLVWETWYNVEIDIDVSLSQKLEYMVSEIDRLNKLSQQMLYRFNKKISYEHTYKKEVTESLEATSYIDMLSTMDTYDVVTIKEISITKTDEGNYDVTIDLKTPFEWEEYLHPEIEEKDLIKFLEVYKADWIYKMNEAMQNK